MYIKPKSKIVTKFINIYNAPSKRNRKLLLENVENFYTNEAVQTPNFFIGLSIDFGNQSTVQSALSHFPKCLSYLSCPHISPKCLSLHLPNIKGV